MKNSWANLCISVIVYYVVRTIYYIIFPYTKPDIDIIMAFFIWRPILIISCFITQKAFDFYNN